MNPAPAPAKPVGAVMAALAILRHLGAAAGPLRLSDITRDLDLNNSTTLNILRTLEYEGLVSLDRASKRYALAQGVVDLAAPLLTRDQRQRRLEEALNDAARDLAATVFLWRVVGEEVELVALGEAPSAMRIAFTVGRRLPVLLGAMGRLYAGRADLSAADTRRLFDAVPWNSRPATTDWMAEVTAGRTRGWALDHGHVNPGILGVAVPVELVGPIEGLVSAALFEGSHTADSLPGIVSRLQQIAAIART